MNKSDINLSKAFLTLIEIFGIPVKLKETFFEDETKEIKQVNKIVDPLFDKVKKSLGNAFNQFDNNQQQLLKDEMTSHVHSIYKNDKSYFHKKENNDNKIAEIEALCRSYLKFLQETGFKDNSGKLLEQYCLSLSDDAQKHMETLLINLSNRIQAVNGSQNQNKLIVLQKVYETFKNFAENIDQYDFSTKKSQIVFFNLIRYFLGVVDNLDQVDLSSFDKLIEKYALDKKEESFWGTMYSWVEPYLPDWISGVSDKEKIVELFQTAATELSEKVTNFQSGIELSKSNLNEVTIDIENIKQSQKLDKPLKREEKNKEVVITIQEERSEEKQRKNFVQQLFSFGKKNTNNSEKKKEESLQKLDKITKKSKQKENQNTLAKVINSTFFGSKSKKLNLKVSIPEENSSSKLDSMPKSPA